MQKSVLFEFYTKCKQLFDKEQSIEEYVFLGCVKCSLTSQEKKIRTLRIKDLTTSEKLRFTKIAS